MVQEKQPFSVLYVGLHKEDYGLFLLAGTTSKGNREDENVPIW